MQKRWIRIYKKKIDEVFEFQRLILSFDLHIIYVSYTESTSRYHIFWKDGISPLTKNAADKIVC